MGDSDDQRIDLKKVPKIKAKMDEDSEKQSIFTFNELLTKIDSENKNSFKPCTLSLRKIDARNRKILEGNGSF